MSKKKVKETKTVQKKIVNEANAQAWLDKVSPSALEFKKDSFVLEQAYCTVYSIFNYPPEVGLKWLRPISLLDNVIISIINEQGDKTELVKAIEYSIREQQVKALETAQTRLAQSVDAEAQIEKSLELSQRIMSENVNVGKVNVYIEVFAESQDDLKKKCKDVEGKLSGLRFTVRRFPYLQEDGFDSLMPICENKYRDKTALSMPLDVFYASMGMISSFGLNDPTGQYLGYDESSNPIFLDLWAKSNGRTNSNLAIMGKSGSGKSATTKSLMLHELSRGTRMFVLDPEEEYLALAQNYGGNIVAASGGLNPDGTTAIINPLQLTDFPKEWDDLSDAQIAQLQQTQNFQGSISLKITALKDWFKIYQPELSMEHLALIEIALYETYKRKGLTEYSDPRNLRNDENPTLTDLGNVLKEFEEAELDGSIKKVLYGEILIFLNSALVGADRFLFNGHTNIDLNNKFTVFNVHSLLNAPDNIKNAQFANLTNYIWLELTKNRNEKCTLAVDEAHLFINEKSVTTFEFLGQLCKRARKYSAALWITTQNITDFLHPSVARYGEGILNNCSIRLLMKSDGTDLEKITRLFVLNDGEHDLIKMATRGQGLLIAGDMRVFANIEIEKNVLKLCESGGGK